MDLPGTSEARTLGFKLNSLHVFKRAVAKAAKAPKREIFFIADKDGKRKQIGQDLVRALQEGYISGHIGDHGGVGVRQTFRDCKRNPPAIDRERSLARGKTSLRLRLR